MGEFPLYRKCEMKVREIESTSKQELLSGFITQEMFDRIWERYGIW